MTGVPEGLFVRLAARILIASLLLSMMLRFLAWAVENREHVWAVGSLCTQSLAPAGL